MNAGCAGKTVRSLENVPYLSALEVCSRRITIQIHVYVTLPYRTFRDGVMTKCYTNSHYFTSITLQVTLQNYGIGVVIF